MAALARVGALLEQAGIDYWLFGGWAVDFYAGAIGRAHDDLDIAVWQEDLPRIAELLENDGWRHAPLDDEDGGTGYEQGPVRLELTYLVRDEDGRVFTPLRRGRAPWSEEALGGDVGELHGVRSRLVALAPLRRGKAAARDDPAEAAKDRADFMRLSHVRADEEVAQMSVEQNKDLIRRYIQAIDDNQTSDWSILDDFIAEDFVAHNPPIPGVSLDREGMKHAAEIFRVATPGRHEILVQVAEGDLVVTHVVGRGVHAGELLGIAATNREVETEGIAIHRVRDGKIVEYSSVTDIARVLQQVGVLPPPG